MNKLKVIVFFILGLTLTVFGDEIKHDRVIPPYPPMAEIEKLANTSQIVVILKVVELKTGKDFIVDKVIKGKVAKNHFDVYKLEVDPLMPEGSFFVYFFGVSRDNPADTVNSLVTITGDKVEVVGGERILFKGYTREEIIGIICQSSVPKEIE